MSTPDAATEVPAGAVLALRAIGLGDALTGIPALRALRRAFPDRPLVLAAGAVLGDFLLGAGVIDLVLPTRELDPLPPVPSPVLALDLHGNGPASHDVVAATRPQRLVCFASPAAGYPDGPTWRQDEHEVDRWLRVTAAAGAPGFRQDLLLTAPPGASPREPDLVVLHPGAAFASRKWPADRWAVVAEALQHRGFRVVLTGSGSERLLCESIRSALPDRGHEVRVTAGELDLDQLTDLVRRAALLVCGDTGVAHLATAVRTRSVLLFGPTPPAWWGPVVDLDRHTVLWPAPPGYRGEPHGTEVDPVLAAIEPAAVLDAALAQLDLGAG